MKIIAVIPARSGSKSLKNKNIHFYKNKPLIYHSIKIAQRSKYIDRILVTTDFKNIWRFQKNLEQKYHF